MTDRGFDLLRTAAPTHLRGVRRHLIDQLTAEQRAALTTIFEAIAEHLRALP